MKKYMSLVLAVLMALTVFPGAVAEDNQLADDPTLKTIAEAEEKQDEATLRASSRGDLVEIDGNEYAVVTGENIGIGYTVKGEDIYVFTQDYLHQAEQYEEFYKDPLAAASKFVKNGMHMNIYDAANDVDVYIYVSSAEWAMLYPDAEEMTDAETERMTEYFKRNGFDVADDTIVGKAGSNKYFFFNCCTSDNAVFMFTSVGGYEVHIQWKATTREQVSIGLNLLDNLVIADMS